MARKTYYLPDELEVQLKARAGELQRSASWCVQQAVEAWLGALPAPEGADRASAVAAPDAPGAAQSPATPRASVTPPLLSRVQRLGVPAKPIPRRSK